MLRFLKTGLIDRCWVRATTLSRGIIIWPIRTETTPISPPKTSPPRQPRRSVTRTQPNRPIPPPNAEALIVQAQHQSFFFLPKQRRQYPDGRGKEQCCAQSQEKPRHKKC